MGLIIGLVFVGVFALIALPLAAMGPSSSAKQALATLDSAIKVDRRDLLPQKLNVRKNELLSSIPWLNQKLLKFELTPYLRNILSQADLDWSAGRLLLFCAAGFIVPTYALLETTNSTLLAFVAGCRMPLFFSNARGDSAHSKSICPRRWT
jgi:Flp pilus assembly protein TadB